MKNQFTHQRKCNFVIAAALLLIMWKGTASGQIVSGAMKPKLSNWESKQDRLVLDINLAEPFFERAYAPTPSGLAVFHRTLDDDRSIGVREFG